MGSGRVILVTGGSRSGKSSFAEGTFKRWRWCFVYSNFIVTDEENGRG